MKKKQSLVLVETGDLKKSASVTAGLCAFFSMINLLLQHSDYNSQIKNQSSESGSGYVMACVLCYATTMHQSGY